MDFQAMPDEIIQEIAEFVSIPRRHPFYDPSNKCLGTRDLRSLMRCSHRLHRICEAVLYRNFVEKSPKSWISFIRNILSRPGLAKYVQEVNVTFDMGGMYAFKRFVTDPMLRAIYHHLVAHYLSNHSKQSPDQNLPEAGSPAEGRNADTTAVAAIEPPRKPVPVSFPPYGADSFFQKRQPSAPALADQIPVRDLWNAASPEAAILREITKSIRVDGDWTVMFAYLLTRVTSIQSLNIEVASSSFLDDETRLFTDAMSFAGLELRDLREISVSYETRQQRSWLDPFVPMLQHPNLKTFTGDHIQQSSALEFPSGAELQHFSFESMTLSRSNLSPATLESLLGACPNLKYLKYEHDHTPGEKKFFPRLFGTYIAHLTNTLEELVLYRAAKFNKLSLPSPEEFGLVGSLQPFRVLRSVAMTANLLLGPQTSDSPWYTQSQRSHAEYRRLLSCLPGSLERLELKECGERLAPDVLLLVESHLMDHPNLKEIVLCYKDFTRDNYFGGFEERVWRRSPVHRELNMAELDRLEKACKAKGIVFEVQFS